MFFHRERAGAAAATCNLCGFQQPCVITFNPYWVINIILFVLTLSLSSAIGYCFLLFLPHWDLLFCDTRQIADTILYIFARCNMKGFFFGVFVKKNPVTICHVFLSLTCVRFVFKVFFCNNCRSLFKVKVTQKFKILKK